MLRKGSHMRRALAVGQAAAYAHEHRHVRHADDGLGDTGLGREGVDGDNGVGVDVLDNGHIGAEHQLFDAAAKHADAAALADAVGHGQRVLAQRALVGGDIFLHSSFLSSDLLFSNWEHYSMKSDICKEKRGSF